jgi:hypothetical protein
MRPTVPDLSEPLFSPRRVRRIVIWAVVLAALVAFCVYSASNTALPDVWRSSR